MFANGILCFKYVCLHFYIYLIDATSSVRYSIQFGKEEFGIIEKRYSL